jgi:hypothetical protein
MSAGENVVEDALNVSVTVKKGNLANNLKKSIFKAVSSLRKEFAKLSCEVEDKNRLSVWK